MIEETGVVVAVKGESAWVETRRKSVCGQCSANKGCGTAVLAKTIGRKTNTIRVLNTRGARAGDEVVIGIREDSLVKGSFAVYFVPLLGLLLGALLGEYLGQWLHQDTSEWPVILSGLAGMAAGFYWVNRFTRRIHTHADYQPVILRLVRGA